MPKAIDIVLVDDHDIVRRGVRELLESTGEFRVVAEGSRVADALELVEEHQPQMAILDVQMPDGSGVEACRDIRSQWPDVTVLMLTAFADEQAFVSAVMAGASGYILKRIQAEEMIDSVRRAARGESLLDAEFTNRLIAKAEAADHGDPLLTRLSPQELKVLELIAQGHTNREIADEIFLAEKTIKNYVSNLLSKLEMANRSEAAAYVARLATMRGDDEET